MLQFGFVFNETGFYDVVVDVFNDVSLMQVSKTIEVRRSSVYFNVKVRHLLHN